MQSWWEMTGKAKSSKDQIVKSYLRPFVANLFFAAFHSCPKIVLLPWMKYSLTITETFLFYSAFQCRKEAVYILKIKIALCIGNPTATRSSLRSCPLPIIPLCPSREEGVIFFASRLVRPRKKNAWSQVKLGPASLHISITLNQKRMAVFKLKDALSVLVYGRFYTKDALSVWTNLCKHL